MKLVAQLDFQGYLVGSVQADESPLEPGVFLLPGGAVDAAPPIVPPQHLARWIGDGWVFEPCDEPQAPPDPSPPSVDQLNAAALRRIDQQANDICLEAVGFRASEYEAAEREALAFQAADFQGSAPPHVHAWMSACGMTAEAAARDILAQANAWRNAALRIRSQRLRAKSQVRAGARDEALDIWNAFVSEIRLELGLTA